MSASTSSVNAVNPLLDVQNLEDNRGVDLQRVGIKNVEMPVRVLQKDGQSQSVSANLTLSVGLSRAFKGTHMSRFVAQMADWSQQKTFSPYMLKDYLEEAQVRLQSPSAQIDMAFRYFINKKAPVTDNWAPMAYGCSFHASLETIPGQTGHFTTTLGVVVPISTLCPCSKAISDFGAHNQRAEIKAAVRLNTSMSTHFCSDNSHVLWLEDLIVGLEECSSCPVYPFLKREDEKYVTERQYTNPKFVEDVLREATLFCREKPGIAGFSLEVEALESIHGHNAWASHTENFCQNTHTPSLCLQNSQP